MSQWPVSVNGFSFVVSGFGKADGPCPSRSLPTDRRPIVRSKDLLHRLRHHPDGNDAEHLANDPIHKLLLGRDPVTGDPLASQPFSPWASRLGQPHLGSKRLCAAGAGRRGTPDRSPHRRTQRQHSPRLRQHSAAATGARTGARSMIRPSPPMSPSSTTPATPPLLDTLCGFSRWVRRSRAPPSRSGLLAGRGRPARRNAIVRAPPFDHPK